jgi:hypothetical protein
MGDIGSRPVRHHGGEVSGGMEAQAAAVLWKRNNSEHEG